ncbi:D-alanyl-D-alanine carboxypeptidase [Candidatus Shapirobacteria bacterium]|nr:D-alanyl-D-alanine carboxypeptidase [Candidatus Shapirobacteria bacterium]
MKSKKIPPKPSLSPKSYLIAGVVIAGILLVVSIPLLRYFGKTPIPAQTVDPLSAYAHPPVPQVTKDAPPTLLAQSYILIDNTTNTILLSKNINYRIYPASITKLATALTALNIYPLDEVVSIGSTYAEGKVMELLPGEKISVRSLVTALLVYSANDSAYNLALNHQDGVPGFVKEMNLIAKKYNLKDTNFVNYDGIHSPSHYSTVYDLSQLGRIAIKNPVIRETVKNKKLTVTDITGKISHSLDSTNELLDVIPEIQGLKTGWTPEAGGCFISLINIGGHEMIGVVAQSDERFDDTQKIISWAKENINWLPYVQSSQSL